MIRRGRVFRRDEQLRNVGETLDRRRGLGRNACLQAAAQRVVSLGERADSGQVETRQEERFVVERERLRRDGFRRKFANSARNPQVVDHAVAVNRTVDERPDRELRPLRRRRIRTVELGPSDRNAVDEEFRRVDVHRQADKMRLPVGERNAGADRVARRIPRDVKRQIADAGERVQLPMPRRRLFLVRQEDMKAVFRIEPRPKFNGERAGVQRFVAREDEGVPLRRDRGSEVRAERVDDEIALEKRVRVDGAVDRRDSIRRRRQLRDRPVLRRGVPDQRRERRARR